MKSSMEVIIIVQWKKCTFENFALIFLGGGFFMFPSSA